MLWSYIFIALVALTQVKALAIAPVNNAIGSCQMVHKPTPGPNLRCGWPGPLDQNRVSTLGNSSFTSTLELCADLCHSTGDCVSFGFSNEQACQLYDKSLLNMNIALPNGTTGSSTTFYNHGCWKQECATVSNPCVCTAKFTGNIVVSLMCPPC